MSRSRTRRFFDALRRIVRRRRAPSPGEAEWLRLILLLRRLQHGQLASLQRLDGVRTLASSLGAFRGDFRALHAQLGAARDAAAELDRGLGERLAKLDALPDPASERHELDGRLAKLDELTRRLAPLGDDGRGALPPALAQALERLASLAGRMESALALERAQGAGDELAKLYERIQELAEAMARAPLAPHVELAPAVLPELPPDAVRADPGEAPAGASADELETLRVTLAAAHEAHRRADSELGALRGQLRASELARIELETRHAAQLAEVADHAGRQLQRLEEELKKKKRGLADLTQQNIQLQNLVVRLQTELPPPSANAPAPRPAPAEAQPEPPAPLPRGVHRPLTGRKRDEVADG